MIIKSIWIALFSVAFFSCVVMADDQGKWTPSKAEKVVALHDGFMESSDWEMAELIALGAKEKFGDKEPAIQRMLEDVWKARAKANAQNPRRKYCTVYSLANVPLVIEKGFAVGSQQVIGELENVITPEVMAKTDSSIAPYKTRQSLVICTTHYYHNRFKERLSQMRAEQPEIPAEVEAK